MKRILVATNFSKAADSAFNLALMLARQAESHLILLHVINITYNDKGLPEDIEMEENDQLARTADLRMIACSQKLTDAGLRNFECHVLSGSPAKVISKFAADKSADLMILGLRGEKNSDEILYGSTAIEVLEKSEIPVLAVPEGFVIQPGIRRVTYAAELTNADLQALRTAAELSSVFNAHLTLLHVGENDDSQEEEIQRFHQFTRHVEKEINYPQLSVDFVTGDDLQMELEKYVKAHKTDLLVLSTRHRGFIARIIDPSKTAQLMRVTPVPLLALHHR